MIRSPRDLIHRLRGGGIGAVLARGASAFLVIHVAGVVLGLGVHVVLARAMGAEHYGIYVWVYNLMMLLLLVGRSGLGTASMRYVAAFVAQEDWRRLRGYLRMTGIAVGVASLIVALVTAAVVAAVGDVLSGATRTTLWLACLALPVYAFLQVGGYILRGFKRVLSSQVPSTLLQPGLLGLGAILLVVVGGNAALDAPRGMLLNLGSSLCSLGMVAIALRRATPVETRGVAPRTETAAWLRTAAPLFATNALTTLTQRTDVLLLGSLLDPTAAGLYMPATRIATAIAFGLMAVSAWAAPLISDLHARGDHAGLQRLARLAARGIFALTLPLCVVVVFFGRELLGLFGPEFGVGYEALLILSGGQLVNAAVGPVGFLLTMTGRHNVAVLILGIFAFLNVVLNAALIPSFGLEGAAVATTVTRVGWNLALAVVVWRHMRVRAMIL